MTTFSITAPIVTFKCRVSTDEAPGFTWQDVTSIDLFKGKRVALIALPGAFTPTCSSTHLPGYEGEYNTLKGLGIDEVYCLSVNDSFVMNAWFKNLNIVNVKPIPDGSGEFTRKLGFLVKKDNLGFGMRSWRYSMILNDGVVEMMWIEPGMEDDKESDPFFVSDVGTMIRWLKENTSAES